MVNTFGYPDCTENCKSYQHGEIISSAISKRSVSDTDLCAFLSFICHRCESVVDYSGRTALHVAASCGRLLLVRWLVRNRNADIDAKDKESGYTALHRSIFYGQIHVAVELIRLGASPTLLDQESLSPFEHSMKDGLKPNCNYGELFYWGSNNNNLFGSLQARDVPDLLEFHKHYPHESVMKICIQQFHIVILTNSGNIFSCGHGREGRLGLGNEASYVTPQLVKLPHFQKEESVFCVDADISRDHSIFLLSNKSVCTCGLNQYMVLGQIPPPSHLLTPKPIKSLSSKNITGICARRYHSLAWNSTAVYAWGLNAGQFGQKSGENNNQLVLSPKSMTLRNDIDISTVGASDGATVIVTQKGTVYVFYEYQCKKIVSKQNNILQVSVVGGTLDSKFLDNKKQQDQLELKVAILLQSGDVFLWQEHGQQFYRCIYSLNRSVFVKHMFLNRNELLLVSEFGEGFKGFIRQRKNKKQNQSDKIPRTTEKEALSRLIEKDDCIYVSLEKIPKIYRAFFIQSDFKGTDYCTLQVHPYKSPVPTDQCGSNMICDLKNFLEGTNTEDGVADVMFELKDGSCPAHKYILSNRCTSFDKKLVKNNGFTLKLPDVDTFVFQQFLLFVYTGDCDILHDNYTHVINFETNKDVVSKQKEKAGSSEQSLCHLAKEFGCISLLECLKTPVGLRSFSAHDRSFSFNRLQSQNFYDITLKCTDGDVMAHRCILSARMEYFGNMLSDRWSGKQIREVNISFPKRTVELLLNFLYTDSLPQVSDVDIDNLLKLLILADQFFVANLKEKCEIFLSNKMTFRNTVEILSFAHLYNANKLKGCCIKFITLNMSQFLESGHLNDLQYEILEEISSAYFEEKKLFYRIITPYSDAVSDEVLLSIANKYPVSSVISESKQIGKNEHKKKTRSHRTSFTKKEKMALLDREPIVENEILPIKSTSEYYEKDLQMNGNNASSNNASRRVQSINRFVNILKSEEIAINYEKLTPDDSLSSLENSFIDHVEFPELGSSFNNSENLMHRSSSHKHESKHKIVKISQKQRKKLNSESDDSQSKTVPELKKSPWKTNFDFGSPISSPETNFKMNDIILNEKKQKDNLVKITNKLLLFTQLEDRAIEELDKFYNAQETSDEVITIERVDTGAVASPSWVPKTK